MVDGVARTNDHLVDSSSLCWSSRGRQRFTELHDEANVTDNALNCPAHEFVGVWETLRCPLHLAARRRGGLVSELHDLRGQVVIKNVQADGTEITEYMVDCVVTARTIDHLVDSSSSRGRQRFTELHDEANVSDNALNCPVHEFVGVWEALRCPLHFAARGRGLLSELHDLRGLAVLGTAVAGYDAAAMPDGLSFDADGLQMAELHPTQVRGGFRVVDKNQMDAVDIVGTSFQDGQTNRVWGAWASCITSQLHVIGDELRKWDPGGLRDLAGFAAMAGDQVFRLACGDVCITDKDNGGLGLFEIRATCQAGCGQEARGPQLPRSGRHSARCSKVFRGRLRSGISRLHCYCWQ